MTGGGRAQQGAVTWTWARRSRLPPPDLGKQQLSSLPNAALLPGLRAGQRSGSCTRGPCHLTREEKTTSPSLLAPAAASSPFPKEPSLGKGADAAAMRLDAAVLRGLPPGRCSWSGGAELHATLQHSQYRGFNGATRPLSSTGIYAAGLASRGSAGLTADGHSNTREHGCARAAQASTLG